MSLSPYNAFSHQLLATDEFYIGTRAHPSGGINRQIGNAWYYQEKWVKRQHRTLPIAAAVKRLMRTLYKLTRAQTL